MEKIEQLLQEMFSDRDEDIVINQIGLLLLDGRFNEEFENNLKNIKDNLVETWNNDLSPAQLFYEKTGHNLLSEDFSVLHFLFLYSKYLLIKEELKRLSLSKQIRKSFDSFLYNKLFSNYHKGVGKSIWRRFTPDYVRYRNSLPKIKEEIFKEFILFKSLSKGK